MKVLVIDNGTHYRRKLNDLLKGFQVDILDISDLKPNYDVSNYNLIVLSGSYKSPSVYRSGNTFFADEKALIRNCTIPVIGICIGAQLIAHEYGARLSWCRKDGSRVKGIKEIWKISSNGVFESVSQRPLVWSSQRWRITELPNTIEAWFASQNGIEVFKVRSKPIYGLQFHPERRASMNSGARIFKKILEIENIAKSSKREA